jgi:predicted enzyme related to lactoylglutathione lyase
MFSRIVFIGLTTFLLCFASLVGGQAAAFAGQAPTANENRATPKLFRIVIMVADVAKAAAFYEKLLGTPGQYVGSGRHYLPAGGTILVLLEPGKDPNFSHLSPQPLPNYLYFAVSDLEAAHEKAKLAGVLELTPIIKQPWGERMFYGKDLDGNPISFVDESSLFKGKP